MTGRRSHNNELSSIRNRSPDDRLETGDYRLQTTAPIAFNGLATTTLKQSENTDGTDGTVNTPVLTTSRPE